MTSSTCKISYIHFNFISVKGIHYHIGGHLKLNNKFLVTKII